jgi:hypothetical protein
VDHVVPKGPDVGYRNFSELLVWVFPSQAGRPYDQDNLDRTWRRVRGRAQKRGVRPLRLHCARHTWASLALSSRKSVRWVAGQLGQADPALTLRVYSHVIPERETDLSFLAFGGPGRPYTTPRSDERPNADYDDVLSPSDDGENDGAPDTTRTFRSANRRISRYRRLLIHV